MLERIRRLPIPLCFIDRWLTGVDGTVVTTDVEKSIRMLMSNILSENIDAAYMVPPLNNPVAKARFEWEVKLLNEAFIPWTTNIDELQQMAPANPTWQQHHFQRN